MDFRHNVLECSYTEHWSQDPARQKFGCTLLSGRGTLYAWGIPTAGRLF